MSKKHKRSTAEHARPKLFQKMGYQLGQTIGKGTYSKVCIAANPKGKKFACKIINTRYAGEDFIMKFLPRELEIITSIKHPNIVSIYKILEVNQDVYMFMDFCEQGDLLEYIRIYGPFTEEKTKNFFKQIVDAIFYLHDLDIAHRDIKCENIFLTGKGHLKLGDFGFARYCESEPSISALSNTFCGSAAYAAPEILQGLYYDPKKYDIWALGCVLYIMLTASMPYDDSNIKKMVKDQLNQIITDVTNSWVQCTVSLRKLQNSLLEPDMDKRISIKQVASHVWFKEAVLNKTQRLLSISDSSLL